MILYIIKATNILLVLYLALSGLYFLIFSVAALFYKDSKIRIKDSVISKVAVLIPAYKEDEVILQTAMAASLYKSLNAAIEVYILEDQLKSETLAKLSKMNVNVISITLKNSSKSKAIKYALNFIKTDFDYAIVLDADNIMEENFVDNIVQVLKQGAKIVQGHRIAKNINTDFAVLDAISEEVNNSIFRSGHIVLGFSASLIGSGFGVDYRYFQTLILNATSMGGFDKELELMIINEGHQIKYCKSAIVYDEKVQKSTDFVNQRRRWLSAQFVYLFKKIASPKIKHKIINLDLWDKRIQFLIPPRIMAIGISLLLFLMMFVFWLLGFQIFLELQMWAFTFCVNIIAVMLSVPKRFYNIRILKSLLSLPLVFFLIIKALLLTKGANKRFIHTSHGIKN